MIQNKINLNSKMKEKKYELFYDYLNSFNAENIKENKHLSNIKISSSNIQNYSNYKSNSKNTNNELNSINIKERIKERQKAFNKIYLSINKILSKYNSNKNICNESNKENQDINIKNSNNTQNNNNNANRIAEHLINTFSKEELNLIKEKINNKMEEYDEPKPEIFLPNQIKKSKTKLKLAENLIKNKNKIFDKIKLNINIQKKHPKNQRNTTNLIRTKTSNNFNTNSNSTFLTYVKCKTSFEYLDNLLKKQKDRKIKREKTEINIKNIKNKTPNRSINTSKKFLIKTKAKNKEKEKAKNKGYTPIKYINHKYDYITSLYKNDKFLMKRIKEQRNKNDKKYEKIKEEKNKEILEQCTFKPIINKTSNKTYLNKMIKSYKDNKTKYYLTETDNKNLSYMDFYQYKKNLKKNRNNKNDKSQNYNKSLTLKENPKKLKMPKSDKKKKVNKNSFLEFHQLIIQKSLKELNDSNLNALS